MIKKFIERDLNKTGSIKRYRAMWNTLKQSHGVNASRDIAVRVLKKIIPNACKSVTEKD